MDTSWAGDDVLAAASSHLRSRRPDPGPTWTFGEVRLDGDRILVIVGLPETPGRFGVYYSLDCLPHGPNTGEVCDTPEDWAVEVAMDLDEFACGADRIPGPGGVMLLRWWSVDTLTRP
jgi:hypothetical protein